MSTRTIALALAVFVIVPKHAPAQAPAIAYVDPGVCCIAPDGRGGNYVISSPTTAANATASGISVAHLDSGGKIIARTVLTSGAGKIVTAATADQDGNLWLAGFTNPTTASNLPTGLLEQLDPTGNVLYSGAFGGTDSQGQTRILAIASDSSGNLYLAGTTNQSDFPVTGGALLTAFPAEPASSALPLYGFVTKLKPGGVVPPYSLVYSTLLGGHLLPQPPPGAGAGLTQNQVSAISIAPDGVATLAGLTTAADFPVTPGAYQTQFTGTNTDVNVFVTRLNAGGSGLIWSTYLGRGTFGFPSLGVAIDPDASAIITGITTDSTFPVSQGAIHPQFPGITYPFGLFVSKLDPAGAKLVFSTFYGSGSSISGPRIDPDGNIWFTASAQDPATVPAVPGSPRLGNGVVAEVTTGGSQALLSELLPNGMAGQDLVLNPDGSLTVASSPGFVSRLPRSVPDGAAILGVSDSAGTSVTKSVAPGEYLSIYGTGLGPVQTGGTQVFVAGVAAPLIYVSDNQVNALVPYGLPQQPGSPIDLLVKSSAGTSEAVPLSRVDGNPNIFVILNSDGSVNSSASPASFGSTITLLVSGAGTLDPAVPDGTIATKPLPAPSLPIKADFINSIFQSFGGPQPHITQAPSYAGSIAGNLVNLLQVDVVVPNLSCLTPCSVSVLVGDISSAHLALYTK